MSPGGGPSWVLMLGSSNVVRARWWDSDQWRTDGDDWLDIQFKDGAIYRYWGVTERVWEAFQAASSYGKFVHKVIRNNGQDNVYTCKRIA